MKLLKRTLLAIVILLLVVVIGLYLQNSKPTYDGELSLDGPIANIEVLYRNPNTSNHLSFNHITTN